MLRWNDRLVAKSAWAESKLQYPTPAETIGLAKRARFHGMTIDVEPSGAHFVIDPKADRRHFVTAVSCDCRQFIGSGSAGCQHLALLQVSLGWIPEAVAAPELAAA